MVFDLVEAGRNELTKLNDYQKMVWIKLDYFRHGTPTDNPHIDSFNGGFRFERLNTNGFMFLEDAIDKVER